MEGIYISLGSNIGDRHENLDQACEELENRGVDIVRKSSIYESQPVGFSDQDDFLNQVLEVSTDLSPQELLKACLSSEESMGRIRTVKNGPRVIDIDVLFYEDQVLSEDMLLLPHPRITDRRFIMVPLAELAGEEEHPVLGDVIQDLLDDCDDEHWVEKSA